MHSERSYFFTADWGPQCRDRPGCMAASMEVDAKQKDFVPMLETALSEGMKL